MRAIRPVSSHTCRECEAGKAGARGGGGGGLIVGPCQSSGLVHFVPGSEGYLEGWCWYNLLEGFN